MQKMVATLLKIHRMLKNIVFVIYSHNSQKISKPISNVYLGPSDFDSRPMEKKNIYIYPNQPIGQSMLIPSVDQVVNV